MQKIELRQNLRQIINRTRSHKIVEFFDKNENSPNGLSDVLLNLIIESKSGYDQAILDNKQRDILDQFDAIKFYNNKFYSGILKFVSSTNYTNPNIFLQKDKSINDFYTYHNTLATSYRLVDNLLFQNDSLKESVEITDYTIAEDSGFLSFEVLSVESVDFEIYAKVISSINDLINAVSNFKAKVDNVEFDEKPKLILADSGSNTMISVKLPKEISKSISKIINDAWKFITNPSGYKLEKIRENMSETIGILKEIEDAGKKKLISPEQAEIWKRQITNSTNDIIMNNTLTKSKTEEIQVVSNQKLLMDATKKLLTGGEK